MKYQEIIERAEATEDEGAELTLSAQKLREVVRLVEDFDEHGEDGSYSERELSTITGLRDLLSAYEADFLAAA